MNAEESLRLIRRAIDNQDWIQAQTCLLILKAKYTNKSIRNKDTVREFKRAYRAIFLAAMAQGLELTNAPYMVNHSSGLGDMILQALADSVSNFTGRPEGKTPAGQLAAAGVCGHLVACISLKSGLGRDAVKALAAKGIPMNILLSSPITRVYADSMLEIDLGL
jgi:hypothetical protein